MGSGCTKSVKVHLKFGFHYFFRIRASKILIVGLSGLGAEIAKNLILAGPKLVTLLDDHEITGNDSLSQFLVPPNSGSKNVSLIKIDFM